MPDTPNPQGTGVVPVVQAEVPCHLCSGRGLIETGGLDKSPGGMVGYASQSCDVCSGTGSLTCDDHDHFGYEHGTDVTISGERRVVFFDYEGDGIFIWSQPADTETDGQGLTDAERQQVYDQLHAWYRDWTAPREEDYL